MSAEKFRQVTDATQAEFLAHQQEVISEHTAGGDHPNSIMLRRLLKLWKKNGSPEKLAHLNRSAMSFSPLAEIVNQYIDPSGEPKVAVLENGQVKLGDATACFGRKCGYEQVCWTQCSLGPSHHNNGALPEGATQGSAIPTHPKGYAMKDSAVNGVLCQVPDPQTQTPRLRSNACGLLSTFQHVFAIPPSPTGAMADALFDQIGPTIEHVENRMEAEKVADAPATAPPAATPPDAPPVSAAPPTATPPQGLPPTPPAAPPQAPPTPPPAGMAPTAPPTGPPPIAPPAMQQPDPAEQETPAPEINAGPSDSFFDNTTIEQEWELRALRQALVNSPVKPMTENTIVGVIERNKATYKKLRGALFKAAASREMTTGSSLKTDKLKKEFWGDVEIPQKYFDEEGGVPEETSEAPPAVQAPPAAPPTAPPTTVAVVASITAQAPDVPRQRIDEAHDEEPPTQEQPQTAGEVRLENLEASVEETRKLREQVEAAARAKPGEYATGETVTKGVKLSWSVLDPLVDALNNFTDAYRERTAVLAGGKKPAKKAQAAAAKKPKAGKKTAPVGDIRPHPKNPKVQKDPCPWQPGTRGRPPKGVKKNAKGEYVLPKGWANIKGKWHPPLK